MPHLPRGVIPVDENGNALLTPGGAQKIEDVSAPSPGGDGLIQVLVSAHTLEELLALASAGGTPTVSIGAAPAGLKYAILRPEVDIRIRYAAPPTAAVGLLIPAYSEYIVPSLAAAQALRLIAVAGAGAVGVEAWV